MASVWFPRACNFTLRFRKSHMPMVLSTDPVARTYSEAGLKERALIASVCPSTVCTAEVVVEGDRMSRIWRVMSSETVPIREA